MLLLHRLERTHSAITLELSAVENDGVARTFLRSSNQRTNHHARTASGQSLDNVARIAQSAVGNQGNSRIFQSTVNVIDRAQLRHAHASHDARRANRTRSDSHFHGIGTVFSKHSGSLARRHVAHNDIDLRESRFYFAQFLDDTERMAVRRVDDNRVGTGSHQRLGTLHRVGRHAHTSGHAQPTFFVFAGHRLVLRLRNVFVGNQTDEPSFAIDNGQFFYFILLKNLRRSRQIGLLMRRDKVFRGHHLVDQLVEPTLEAQVAVRHDAHQMAVIIDHGNAADVVVGHHIERVLHGATATNRHGVVNHTILGPLHNRHLTRLALNRHILVNHADTAFAGNRYRHCRLGDSVHCRRHKGYIQVDAPRKTGLQRHGFGQNLGIGRNEQYVVESQSVHYNFVFYKRCHNISYLLILRCKVTKKN